MEPSLTEESKSTQPSPVCCKCKEQPATIVNRKENVCKDCFLHQLIHRFKSAIRTKLKIWNDELFMIAVSGGANSMAMLDMLHYSIDSNTNRKMFYKVLVLHIDEGVIYGHSEEKRAQKNTEIIDFVTKQKHFDLVIIPLESVLALPETIEIIRAEKQKEEEDEKNPMEEAKTDYKAEAERLATFLESFTTRGSSREDMISILKKKLMRWVAWKAGGIKKVLLGESGFSLSAGVFGALCKGRGASLPLGSGFIDDQKLGDVSFCHPMRELLRKEVSLYNYIRKVPVLLQLTLAQLETPKVAAILPDHGSINELCENFLSELQDHSFMTVPTVMRTAARLSLKEPLKTADSLCHLCSGVLDSPKNALETLSALELGKIEQSPSSEFSGTKLCFACKKLISNSKLPESEVAAFLEQIIARFKPSEASSSCSSLADI